MTVVVAGAGVAGLACAQALAAAGIAVRVRERGRAVGGRLASRRFDGRPADIGAAYFTVSDERFARVAAGWRSAGLARPWTEHLRVYGATGVSVTTAAVTRWAAPGGLRTLAEALADGLDVTLGDEVTSVGPGPVVDGTPADAVVLAMPGPQARRLLDPALTELAAAADAQSWQPVLATVLRYPERTWTGFAGAFVNDHPVLATVCDDGDRRGDGAPVLVAHSTAAFARPHLADPSAAGPALEAATRELLGLPAPATAVHVHRWTYAQPAAGTGDYLLHDGIALAGDAFGAPRVQTAWLSGHLLGLDLARRLGG